MARTDYYAIQTPTLQATSQAIRDVAGSSALITPAEWADEIRALAPKEEKDVNYYDCFGNILYSYSAEEFALLTGHPTGLNISYKGVNLTFEGWNYDFNNAQDYVEDYGKLSIGGTYRPTDNKTHIFLNIGNRAYSDIDIRFTVVASAVVDWGDGTTQTIGSGAYTGKHNYNATGEYHIAIDGSIRLQAQILPDTTQAKYLTCAILGNVASVGGSIFQLCSNLQYVSLPLSLTSLATNSFSYCSSLSFIVVPYGTTTLGNNTFTYCTSLEKAFIPDTVTSIGTSAFNLCASMVEMNLPKSVTSLGVSVLRQCYAIKDVFLPAVTSLNNYSLSNNCTLTKIIIPPTVSSLGTYCFQGCVSLVYADFSLHTSVPTLGGNAFSDTNSLQAIIVPDSLYNTWVAATNWSTYASLIVKASEYIKPF